MENNEKRATIVCCYNNQQMFDEMIDSLEKQSENVDIIAIDNSSNKYKSCAAAFNSVINQVHTKYVIYSHQDIIYNSSDSLSHILDYFEKIGEDDIAGVAGRKSSTKERIGNIKQGRE